MNPDHFHPLIVHFPVALLITGFAADVFSLFISKKEACLSKLGFYLMLGGTLAAVAAYLSGLLYTHEMSGEAGELKEKHELWASITMYIMIAASIIRIFLTVGKRDKGGLKWLVFAMYATGAVCVGYTGFMGGSLVFDFMVGL